MGGVSKTADLARRLVITSNDMLFGYKSVENFGRVEAFRTKKYFSFILANNGWWMFAGGRQRHLENIQNNLRDRVQSDLMQKATQLNNRTTHIVNYRDTITPTKSWFNLFTRLDVAAEGEAVAAE